MILIFKAVKLEFKLKIFNEKPYTKIIKNEKFTLSLHGLKQHNV